VSAEAIARKDGRHLERASRRRTGSGAAVLAVFYASVVCVSETPGNDAPRMIAIAGGTVVVALPGGWEESKNGGATTLTPSDTGACAVRLLPVEKVGVGFQEWFTEAWWRFKEDNAAEEQVPAKHYPAEDGNEVAAAYGAFLDRGGARVSVMYHAVRRGCCVQPVVVLIGDTEAASLHMTDILTILASVRFPEDPSAGAEPMAVGNSASDEELDSILVGEWGSTSATTVESYTFTADHSYAYSGLLQSSFGGCTMSVFNTVTGKWSMNVDRLTLQEERFRQKSADSCGSANYDDKERPVATHVYPFRIKRGEHGLELALLNLKVGEMTYRRR